MAVVLGSREQSVKQLRGSLICYFCGYGEPAKLLSYAYVAITLDNSDHKLANTTRSYRCQNVCIQYSRLKGNYKPYSQVLKPKHTVILFCKSRNPLLPATPIIL